MVKIEFPSFSMLGNVYRNTVETIVYLGLDLGVFFVGHKWVVHFLAVERSYNDVERMYTDVEQSSIVGVRTFVFYPFSGVIVKR